MSPNLVVLSNLTAPGSRLPTPGFGFVGQSLVHRTLTGVFIQANFPPMEWLTDPEAWLALLTLTAMEIVLGIDNIVFISILTGKLPRAMQERARIVGLAGALVMRVLLLLSLTWIMGLTTPLFTVLSFEISGRDLIMLGGGLFLLAKGTYEIHDKLEGEEAHDGQGGRASFGATIIQIMLLDIVFSLDSVITAIGMASHVEVMIVAVIIAVGFMMLFSGKIGEFVHRHPTVKMLALSFLLLIGVTLVADGLHQHIPKGYVYFAMAFSLAVEILNLRIRKHSAPLEFRGKYAAPAKRPRRA
jgi:predicted tellurium resistance membrane protein TerC